MSGERRSFGLSPEAKTALLERLARRRGATTAARQPNPATPAPVRIGDLDGQDEIRVIRSAGEVLGIANPFFRTHDSIAGPRTVISGRSYLNFSSYNYLGLNGHPRVAEAAKAAIDRYGTSVSASRLVSGERGVHRDLERGLAELYGAEDCIALVSGHATNVTVIGHLMQAKDLILHDALAHNSILQGAVLSGARRASFAHNDAAAAERLLAQHRAQHRRALVVIEGHYSMDGDVPDLPAFIALARRHGAWLMVDEAHALGVLGRRGFGLAEHFAVDPGEVDLWMGTLSKTLAACGGYIASRREMVEYLKFTAPGFLYSVGMSPPVAAAALAALGLLREEPERVRRLNANARLFRDLAKAAGLDTGNSAGHGIVPIVTGSSIAAARLADALFQEGINVQPILYPAVPERSARLRFFLCSEHGESDIRAAVAGLARAQARIAAEKPDLRALAARLGALGGE
ncbi:MAG TPA: aminotransferase class I/II-fold pyridoxal phosphate-dependent enzyme [Stellaceae bacterium]|nr:aminotransferase class I/II-fold pyridoxal phosphate-dependent enzyme [Stellaceae bacterium]